MQDMDWNALKFILKVAESGSTAKAAQALAVQLGYSYVEAEGRYRDFLNRFPNDRGALVVFEGLLCSDEGWQLIRDSEAAFSAHPMIDRTISLASPSSRYIVTDGDLVDLSRFADAQFDSAQARCEAAFQRLTILGGGGMERQCRERICDPLGRPAVERSEMRRDSVWRHSRRKAGCAINQSARFVEVFLRDCRIGWKRILRNFSARLR